MNSEWYLVENAELIDSPALLLYEERIKRNIGHAIAIAGDVKKLRPHVKTNKMAEVCAMLMDAGITKFKCATIAEAEMLGMINTPDVLIAYPLAGPRVDRFIRLIKKYPRTHYSCLVDNENAAKSLSEKALENDLRIDVFIDLNTGMNRSGVVLNKVDVLLESIKLLRGINVRGLHAYDGHIRDIDLQVRQLKADAEFDAIKVVHDRLERQLNKVLGIVIGGSPAFSVHAKREKVECSPGTFVFWDYGYHINIPEQPFEYAAVLLTRVISIIDEQLICTDLGYKAVASESPLPRVYFLNLPDAEQVSQSEEHLVLKVADTSGFTVGDILYAVPLHICPSVALYETAQVIENNRAVKQWRVIARDRKITI